MEETTIGLGIETSGSVGSVALGDTIHFVEISGTDEIPVPGTTTPDPNPV